MRVAALDDEQDQLALIRQSLVSMGHDCHAFTDSKLLIKALRRESFDLLLLDWQLPDMSGLDVLSWTRANLKEHLPVMFVTNRTAEFDLMQALGAGADDFMVKPIRLGELRARVQALLRRAYRAQEPQTFTLGRYRFDAAVAEITLDRISIPLKQREFDLALFLFRNAGRLLSRKHLQEAVWGVDGEANSRSLDTHVSRLRAKLKLHPENGFRLSAVYSVGYRLEIVGDAQIASAPAGTAAPGPILRGAAATEAAIPPSAPRSLRSTRTA